MLYVTQTLCHPRCKIMGCSNHTVKYGFALSRFSSSSLTYFSHTISFFFSWCTHAANNLLFLHFLYISFFFDKKLKFCSLHSKNVTRSNEEKVIKIHHMLSSVFKFESIHVVYYYDKLLSIVFIVSSCVYMYLRLLQKVQQPACFWE